MSGSSLKFEATAATLKESIKIEATKIHKGRMAPMGCVFYVAKVKHKGMIYTQCVPVYRGGVDDAKEAEGKEKFRELFYNELLKKLKIKIPI